MLVLLALFFAAASRNTDTHGQQLARILLLQELNPPARITSLNLSEAASLLREIEGLASEYAAHGRRHATAATLTADGGCARRLS
jgi:hypothetical protein